MTTYLVTGSNRGIGLELCRHLQARGDRVIAVCRSSSQELDRMGVQVEAGVDVTSDDDVAALAARLAGQRLDALILNAGVLAPDTLEGLDFQAVRQQIEINTFGPLRVTKALLSNLGAGSKIAIITSRMGSLADNGSGGYYGYRMSKAAVNMAGVSLARDLVQRQIAVALLHPGFVRTAMTGGAGSVAPDESARQLLERVDALTLAETGSFWHASGEALPW